jgi:NAD-dependent deacetylase
VARHNVEELRQRLEDASSVVFFTGAGISTESGIPDFRSPGGIWTTNQPIMFEDFISSPEIRKEGWRRKVNLDRAFKEAAPNRGHRAVARLVTDGKANAVITQNIDNLHQASGVPTERVIELHGNGTYATCLDCGRHYELAPILASFEEDESLPVCRDCEGIIKTATISFGQPMPVEAMRRAEQATLACDLFIAIGSSLVVYPAAGFPAMAKQNGAALVILNREPTGLDSIADLVLNEEIGETLGGAVGVD